MQLRSQCYFFFAILLFPLAAFPQKTVQKAPKAYRYPTGVIAAAGAAKDPNTNLTGAWIVFSDRSNNPTYQAPDGLTQMKTMKFMEAFYVVEEKGNYLRLVKYDAQAFRPKGKLAVELEDYGYAPKDKLLLWRRALVEPESKFTIKALSVNSVEVLKDIVKYAGTESNKKMRLYDDPGMTKENKNDFRLFDFIYILKKNDKSVLVSTQPELQPGECDRASQYVMGWASKDVIQEWSSRICLEPNPDFSAAAERKEKGIKVSLFGSNQGAESFKAGSISEQPLWNKDLYDKSYIPEWKRLPIMHDYGNGIIKTGVVSDVFDKDGREIIKSEEQLKIEREYNNVRDNFRKVNIVLVYDGSEAVPDNYFDALRSAIDSLASQFSTANETGASLNAYRMGAVVYRDYAEKNCADGNIMVYKKSLSNNPREVSNFLQNERPRNCADKSKEGPQALYFGIGEALKMLKDYADETNIILIAGISGNRTNDPDVGTYTQDFLVRQLAKNQCSIFAFQIMNEGKPDQIAFRSQIADLIEKSSQEIQGQYDRLFKKKSPEPYFKTINSTTIILDPATSPIPGTFIYADQNNRIGEYDLVELIVKNINGFIEKKEDMLRDMSSRIKGQGTMKETNPGMYGFLLKMHNVDVELLQKASYSNLQFFTEAYTPMTSDKLTNPLYQHVLFLRQQELSYLEVSLRKIFSNSGTDAEQREMINDAFRETVAQYFGPDKVKEVMSTWTAAQLTEKITGLPAKSELLKKYKLNDFTDKKAVPPQELQQILLQIGKKLKDLQTVVNDVNNKYSFKSNDFQYYWVPEKFMP